MKQLEVMEGLSVAQSPEIEIELLQSVETVTTQPARSKLSLFWEMIRFAIVGIINTSIDLFILNCLLWLLPTHNAGMLVVYNSVAYIIGAVNSFLLNKYWTFHDNQKAIQTELLRFAVVNLFGLICNDALLWFAAGIAHPLMMSPIVWANFSKVFAIGGTAAISFLGMRLWVFAGKTRQVEKKGENFSMSLSDEQKMVAPPATSNSSDTVSVADKHPETNGFLTNRSLSVVLPAHNEEAIIAQTVNTIVTALTPWVEDFEVIVVDDGSQDQTRTIIEQIAATNEHVRTICHPVNQGYGAALVSGFKAVTKDLAFFTDSDGQFDIRDIEHFFSLAEHHDAVVGYRIDRQDTWIRKLNAWGWKMLVSLIFRIQVRDVDCAFKLYRTKFLQQCDFETQGAMINTEMLYKLKRLGYTYTQIGVHHLPRTSGKATGAKLTVILRAFRELFAYAYKWRREEQKTKKHVQI